MDVFDRLPTPFGLVRAGVAPDHPKIKSVIRVYEKTAAREGFRFFGNVEVGRQVSAAELAERYHAVIHAYGSPTDRRLGIPGEDLEGSHPATAFVAWYNAHPDFADLEFDLSCERAVVIGNGNVATDLARMLALTREELEATDTAEHAIDVLGASKVREIVVLGRRGPAQAAFTNPELRELGEMKDADVDVDPAEVELDDLSRAYLASERGGHHDSQERRDLHRVLAAPAGGQAQADRAAVPSLAGRDPGRRQGGAADRGAQRALPRRVGRDPGSRHRRARDARVRARLPLDRLQGGRAWRASRSTSVAA